ncbi:unknown protein [Seminavis robusta]|uniref:Replication associated protein n=1 Tax=Seminavis robusta TaxID=568900 RepID=A0A9N8HUA8_9STRA|nr:unknown protein [Seminavis robusta]|eukprot:Sro2025_g311660.1 n/a (558) ;mRNA; f:15422-17186
MSHNLEIMSHVNENENNVSDVDDVAGDDDVESLAGGVLSECESVRIRSGGGSFDPDLEGIVGNEEGQITDNGVVLASEETDKEKKARPKLQHVALTLWDTDEVHREELKRMHKRWKWIGVLHGKEYCPDTGRPHMHVDKLGYFKYCKKDGDFRITGEIFTDSNRKGEERQDRHDLRNAIYEEGICDLKLLRYRFPNQMMAPGGERYARQLINDVTPVREPEKFDKEHLWQRELRSKLMQPDNGREIITIHSMQTRQGKSKFMQHLKWEYNQKREGSALILTVAPAKDLIDTIKDYRHSLELLVLEIPKAKGEPAFLKGVFSLLELIKNGEAFAPKYTTEPVRFRNNVKIIICRNDMHKPDSLYGKDREAYMDVSIDTWEWVPHRVLEERWNEQHPGDEITIFEEDYDEEGWFVEWHGKKKTDHGEWFRGRTVEKQIEEMKAEHEKNVINNARRLSQLRRKYLELKIATWIYRQLKPETEEEGEAQMEEETPETPEPLTMEERAMVETLRKINRNRGDVLLKNHKRAAGMLKRKREKEEGGCGFRIQLQETQGLIEYV